MGKRKERRLASFGGAGRRVKLDLFAEPSSCGDLGGSSVNDIRRGELDSKQSAGSPEPSSSGQRPKTPLMLLGQYCDDDDEDESIEISRLAAISSASKVHNDQVEESDTQNSEAVENSGAKNNISGLVEDSAIEDDVQVGHEQQTDHTAPKDIHHETSTHQYSFPESSSLQVIGEVSSGWKMVMHEETKQCYYWNTETGETSWEVPEVLVQADESTVEHNLNSSSGGGNLSIPSVVLESSLGTDGFVNPDQIYTINEYAVIDQSEDKHLVPETGYASAQGASSIGAYNSYERSVDNHGRRNNFTTPDGVVDTGVDDDLPSRVAKFGEYLLERLQSLKGSLVDLNGEEWIARYIFEVEVRLADIRSLLSYGSSLLPFWVHSERKLRQLGEAFNNEASQIVSASKLEANHVSTIFDGTGINEQAKTIKYMTDSPLSDTCNATVDTKLKEGTQYSPLLGNTDTEKICSIGSDGDNAVFGTDGPKETLCVSSDITPSPDPQPEEDMDMDVDMEVEEPAHLSCKDVVQSVLLDSSVGKTTHLLEHGVSVLHPADSEWIPPPPPDDEMIPPPPPPDNEIYPLPPPPVDSPELAAQAPTYTEQYNAYAGYTYGYYGQVVAGDQAADFRSQVEGYQIGIPHSAMYYELPSSYVSNIPVMVNSGEPSLNYDPGQGVLVHPPMAVNESSTGLHSISGLASSESVSNDADIKGSTSSRVQTTTSNAISKTETACVDPTSAITTILAPATISAEAKAPLLPNDNAITATLTSSKGLLKASRVKKRTSSSGPSMRSNKKVSSLVDKWKAAKEELQEDEDDEPDDSYEALEKKRQREIEAWRAQQIASGEAKENANFQPLGGDWRERIKQRRAQMSGEASKNSTEANNETQETDLVKLAKDLPSGWQVYWDESTKQLYYGNTITHETTWARPTN